MDDSDIIEPPQSEPSALATVQQDSYSRQKFLKLVGGTAALGAFGTLLAACGTDNNDNQKLPSTGTTKTPAKKSPAPSGDNGDLAIVNYALTLEFIEADFYAAVISSGLFKGAELELIKAIGEHERQHVEALMATAKSLGTPAAKPETQFPLDSRESVLALAATVENIGAAAYLGQAGRIQSPDILAAALSIHTVEARHAAALNKLTGKPFTPDGAFAKPMTMEQVLPAVKPFLVTSGTNSGSAQ